MNKKIILTVIAAIPMVAIAIIIFLFSAQPAEESSQTSGFVVEIATAIVHTGFDSLSADKQDQVRYVLEIIIRKMAHFTEFACLGGSIHIFLITIPISPEWKRRLASIILGILYAASDEFHQLFVPGREGCIRDVCIDSAGVITGCFIMVAVVMLIKRARRNKTEK